MIYVHDMNGLFDIASPLLYLAIGSAMIVFVAFGVWSLQQRFRKRWIQVWRAGDWRALPAQQIPLDPAASQLRYQPR